VQTASTNALLTSASHIQTEPHPTRLFSTAAFHSIDCSPLQRKSDKLPACCGLRSQFPLVERNPQTFGEIPKLRAEAFRKAVQQVFRGRGTESGIMVLLAWIPTGQISRFS
jgi:hypothetical protein